MTANPLPLLTALAALLGLLVSCRSHLSESQESLPPPGGVSHGWESSGGGGVACFDSEASAAEAAKHVEQGRALPQKLKDKIETLVTLEYWEFGEDFPFLTKFLLPVSQTREMLHRVVTRTLQNHAPLFYSRFQMAKKHIDLSTWDDSQRLPKITDARPVREIETAHPKCRLIPLAVRYSRSRPAQLPEAKVNFDRWLYEHKLDPLNQVMLELHETLYLMAWEGAHRKSELVRALVVLLMDMRMQFALIQTQPPSLAAQQFQAALGTVFGDYYRYFREDPSLQPRQPPTDGPHQYSRYLSFGTLLEKLRKIKGDCLTDHKYDEAERERREELQKLCSERALHPDHVNSSLTEEEALLFVARWIVDPLGLEEKQKDSPMRPEEVFRVLTDENHKVTTSEHLLVWNPAKPDEVTPSQDNDLWRYCRRIDSWEAGKYAGVVEQAKRYCGRLFF